FIFGEVLVNFTLELLQLVVHNSQLSCSSTFFCKPWICQKSNNNGELRKTQVELKSVRDRYVDLFDFAPVGYCTVNEKGLILETNLTAVTLLGVSRSLLINEPFAQFIFQEHQNNFYLAKEKLIATRKSQALDLQIVKKDGALFWAHLQISYGQFYDASTAVRVVISDITERKQMEAVLRRNQSMLARTENIAQLGSWEWDIVTDTVTWSDEMFRLFQRDPADGAPSFAEHPELYLPHDMQRLNQAVEAAISTGAPYELELHAIRKDGSVWVCLARGFAEMSPEKKATRLFGSLQDISERKQAEQALRVSDERYRLVVNNIPDIVYSLDGAGNIITVNSPAFERYGYTEQGSLGKPFLNFIHPDDRQIVIGSFINALQEQRIFTHGLQFRIVAKDGQNYWFELNSQAHFDSAGGYLGEEGILRDITKRKHAENALKEEYNFRTAIENSMQAGVAVIDLAGKQISVNQHFSKLVGWTQDELIGKSAPFVYWPPDEIENINDAFQQTLQGKASETGFELKFMRKNGELFYVLVNLSVLEDVNHETIGWLAVVADITERKLAQEALREAHLQLKGIIEATRAGTWVWNIQTGEGVFNEEWAQIVGYTLAELLPTSITTLERLAHPEDLKHAYKLMERHIAGDLPYYDFEMRMKHKDGHWVWIHDRGRLITRTKDGKPLMMFGTHTDITERKAANEKIQLLNAELEKLVVTDALTQINNRRYFMQRGVEEILRENRSNHPLVLLMMDLDEFKKINDAYGHAVGDLVLQQVATVLSSNIREIDILGRIGGEEFAVLLPNTSLEDAALLAERMRQSIENTPAVILGQAVKITVSIGVAEFKDEMTSISALLRNADAAMYQAKHSGRNCVRIYLPPEAGSQRTALK
ncbi:MAG: PAS domain S-box protein, partial [Chloroflexi bacterium]|nr:PAS domain S-box protein [Chloroflexota bacterium]